MTVAQEIKPPFIISKKNKTDKHVKLMINQFPQITPPSFLFIGIIGNRREKYKQYLDEKFKKNEKDFFDFLCFVFRESHKQGELVPCINLKGRKGIDTSWIIDGFIDFLENIKTPMNMVLGFENSSKSIDLSNLKFNNEELIVQKEEA